MPKTVRKQIALSLIYLILIAGFITGGLFFRAHPLTFGNDNSKGEESLVGNMVSEGTTPRRLTDLIGSLCDLTSGSGDKGTPVVYIQGYFDNYTTGK